MKFDSVVRAVGSLSAFDLNTLKTLFPDERDSLAVQLYRWKRADRVVELRRGVYSLAEPYRRAPLHGPAVAEAIYHPSYLSLEWALSWYGIVPEKAGIYTSVSTRERRTFRNELGVFTYHTVKPELFFGHTRTRIMDADLRLAEPEKALVDLWYLSSGEWTLERMESMRFDADALTDPERLYALVLRFAKPRLIRAYDAWIEYSHKAADHEVIVG